MLGELVQAGKDHERWMGPMGTEVGVFRPSGDMVGMF